MSKLEDTAAGGCALTGCILYAVIALAPTALIIMGIVYLYRHW